MMILSNQRREEFERLGVIKLENFIPDNITREASTTALGYLSKKGIFKDGIWNFDQFKELPIEKANKELRRAIGRSGAYAKLITSELIELMASLIGETPIAMLKPQVLVSIKSTDRWTVPSIAWHWDVPNIPNTGLPGIQMFTFLSDVQPFGGGTLAVLGSHRLVRDVPRFNSAMMKEQLKEELFFNNLFSKTFDNRQFFVEDFHLVEDIPLKVIEMHGKPGDVYIMDLRILHAPSDNSQNCPRIMFTQRFGTSSTIEECEKIRASINNRRS